MLDDHRDDIQGKIDGSVIVLLLHIRIGVGAIQEVHIIALFVCLFQNRIY